MIKTVTENYLGIPLPDFMRLRELKPGMIITFKGMEERLIIGNCTPFETVTATSEEGWAYDLWQRFLVVQVDYIESVNMSAPNWLTPKQVDIVKENVSNDRYESIIPESVSCMITKEQAQAVKKKVSNKVFETAVSLKYTGSVGISKSGDDYVVAVRMSGPKPCCWTFPEQVDGVKIEYSWNTGEIKAL